ncbi:hypothetical protein MLD38_021948 [Melastoma candidum]|uniref:Uncharacterized protein n=1 Tax=Melastoma candidum TaxID=119954 RepID=A0ACB9QLJ8_9MYRT|nr:hypothetical protein MLD38_021948 [Melastoma candidum]
MILQSNCKDWNIWDSSSGDSWVGKLPFELQEKGDLLIGRISGTTVIAENERRAEHDHKEMENEMIGSILRMKAM